jgi:DNA-binding protein H-NS
MNLGELSLNELQDLHKRIEKELVVRKVQEKERLRKQILQQVEAVGLTFDEVFGKGVAVAESAKVKFRDPNNPDNTWAGKGRKPHWLVEALAQGHSLEEYRI